MNRDLLSELEGREAIRLLALLVEGIENWNADVQSIIGRQPDYDWGALAEAKIYLKKQKKGRVSFKGPAAPGLVGGKEIEEDSK